MNNMTSHLPKKNQKDLEKILTLIQGKISIDMLILFGSYARGDWVSDTYTEKSVIYDYKSDYDLLVIVGSEDIKNEVNIWRSIEKEIEDVTKMSVNLIVDTIHFVNKKIQESNYFYLDIKNEGIVLYNSNKFKLTSPTERSKEMMQTDFDFWFQKANSFYKDFKHNIEDGELNNAAFHLSQVTESLYFTILLVFIGYKPKSHNISKISALAEKLVPELERVFLEDTNENRDAFDLLKKAYIDARYRQEYKVTLKQLSYLESRVMVLFDKVEKACKDRIR